MYILTATRKNKAIKTTPVYITHDTTSNHPQGEVLPQEVREYMCKRLPYEPRGQGMYNVLRW